MSVWKCLEDAAVQFDFKRQCKHHVFDQNVRCSLLLARSHVHVARTRSARLWQNCRCLHAPGGCCVWAPSEREMELCVEVFQMLQYVWIKSMSEDVNTEEKCWNVLWRRCSRYFWLKTCSYCCVFRQVDDTTGAVWRLFWFFLDIRVIRNNSFPWNSGMVM